MRFLKRCLWVVGLGFCLFNPSLALSEDFEEDFSQFVQRSLNIYRVPGAVVGVVDKGEVVFLRAYGVRTQGQVEKVDLDTIFQIASVTKTFTAALVGKMVEEKRMSWDQPIADILPSFRMAIPFASENATARDFLVHRSGLPDFTGDFFDRLGFSSAEVLERLRYMPLSAGFRERAAYSNLGFFVAGEAAAKAAGTDWASLLQDRILQPLSMKRTGHWSGTISPTDNVASPHTLSESGQLQAFQHFDEQTVLAPAGIMTSTGNDMVKWLLALLNNGKMGERRVLARKTLEEMFNPVICAEISFTEIAPISAKTGFNYSPGWGVYYYEARKIVEKAGARTGMRSIVTLVPEEELGIVVLSNLNGTAFPEALRAHLLSLAFGGDGKEAQSDIQQSQALISKLFEGLSPEPWKAPETMASCSVESDKVAGRYRSDLYGDLSVKYEDGNLFWQAGKNGYGGHLWPLGRATFLMEVPPGELPGKATFVVDELGLPLELQTENYGSFSFSSGVR